MSFGTGAFGGAYFGQGGSLGGGSFGNQHGKMWQYRLKVVNPHRLDAHPDFQTTVQPGGGIDYQSPLHVNRVQYPHNAQEITNVIDQGSNIVNVEFPGAGIAPDGSLTRVNGVTSAQSYSLQAGQLIELSVQLGA